MGRMERALVGGTAVNLAGFFSRMVLVFLHGYVGARMYGAERYGVYAQGMAVVAILAAATQLGLGTALLHFVASGRAANGKQQLWAALRASLGLSAVVSALAAIALLVLPAGVAALFGDPQVAAALRIQWAAIPFIGGTAILAGFVHGFQDMAPKVLAQDVTGPAVELGLAVVLARLGRTQSGLSVSHVAGALVSCLVMAVFATLRLRRGPESSAPVPSSAKILRQLSTFALPVLAVALLAAGTNRASVLVLGVMGTSAAVGVLHILQRLAWLGDTFLASLNAMFAPMVADLIHQRRIGELDILYKASSRWALASGLPVFIVLATYRYELLGIYGAEFVSGATAFLVLLMGQAINVSTGSCGVVLTMSGHPRDSALGELLMLVTVTLGSILLIPHFGMLGCAMASAIGFTLVNAMRVLLVWKHLKVQPLGRGTMQVLLAAAAMGAVALLLKRWMPSQLAMPLQMVVVVGLAGLTFVLLVLAQGLEPAEARLVHALRLRLVQARHGERH